MKINYGLIIGAILFIFFMNHMLNNKEKPEVLSIPLEIRDEIENGDIQKPIENIVPKVKSLNKGDGLDYPQTTTLTQKLSKLVELLPQNLNNKVKDEPLLIVRNKMNQVLKPEIVKEDTLSPNPIGSTEYKFIDENPKYAWSDINVSQHPKNYKSNFTDELTNAGGFFDNDDDNSYHDRTSSRSKTFLPDRCFMNQNNEILCSYNNRLQNIPPTLIEDKLNNQVLNSIGQGKGDIFKNVEESNIKTINGNSYQSWDYENEKTINGGLFGDIEASSDVNEDYLTIKNINERPSYSI
jgi:hypothetical protein|tara:strand:+ start:1591 stop:2475 length:885 start_codon:yes stop_codon:yes gene_type:complete